MRNKPTCLKHAERLDALPRTSPAERAVLRAFADYAGPEGICWASVATLAKRAGVTPRTVQRAIRSLEKRGTLSRTTPPHGVATQTTTYIIHPFVTVAPDGASGQGGRRPGSRPPTSTPAPPDNDASTPRQAVAQSGRSRNENQQQSAASSGGGGVVALLSDELRSHPNATPERLEWIEREAPSKDNPAGWAAQCIREGWTVPAAKAKAPAVTLEEPTEADRGLADRLGQSEHRGLRDALVKAYRLAHPEAPANLAPSGFVDLRTPARRPLALAFLRWAAQRPKVLALGRPAA